MMTLEKFEEASETGKKGNKSYKNSFTVNT